MPYGYDPILTSFTSITTSSSDCSGEGTKRTYRFMAMSDVEGRADMPEGCSISRSDGATALLRRCSALPSTSDIRHKPW